MKFWSLLATIALVLFATPAQARLDRAALNAIGARPGPLARLPLDLALLDEGGAHLTSAAALGVDMPTALVFVDYHCRNLCGVGLPLLMDAFEKADAGAGACHIVAISLDPAAMPADAVAFRRVHFPRTSCDVRLLMARAPAIAEATRALGYHYARDADTQDFAHDASTYILRPDGSVAALVSEFALQDATLTTALESARRPDGLFNAAWRCICYALDPTSGIYTRAILDILTLACVGLLAIGAHAFWRLTQRMRHAA